MGTPVPILSPPPGASLASFWASRKKLAASAAKPQQKCSERKTQVRKSKTIFAPMILSLLLLPSCGGMEERNQAEELALTIRGEYLALESLAASVDDHRGLRGAGL